MATLTLTFTAGSEAGASLRQLANALDTVASALPDRNPTGASTVLTLDNAAGSVCGLQVTAGPYSGSQVLV